MLFLVMFMLTQLILTSFSLGLSYSFQFQIAAVSAGTSFFLITNKRN